MQEFRPATTIDNLEQTMTNPNDASTGNATRVDPHSNASSPQASKPAAAFPTASQPSAQSFGAGVDAAAKNGADAAHEAVDKASQAGDAFVRRMVDGAHAAIDKLADAAGPTVDRWAGALGNRSDKLSALAGQAGEKKDEWVGDIRQIIRENPIAAIATALAVGAIYVKLTSAPPRANRDQDE